jgi:hypothetical protein
MSDLWGEDCIGRNFLLQIFIGQRDGVSVPQLFCSGLEGAVAGDLVLLNSLCRGNQASIKRGRAFVFFLSDKKNGLSRSHKETHDVVLLRRSGSCWRTQIV